MFKVLVPMKWNFCPLFDLYSVFLWFVIFWVWALEKCTITFFLLESWPIWVKKCVTFHADGDTAPSSKQQMHLLCSVHFEQNLPWMAFNITHPLQRWCLDKYLQYCSCHTTKFLQEQEQSERERIFWLK